MKWKTIKTMWVFLYIKYSKFWSISLEHFVERKPLISEECIIVHIIVYRKDIWASISFSEVFFVRHLGKNIRQLDSSQQTYKCNSFESKTDVATQLIGIFINQGYILFLFLMLGFHAWNILRFGNGPIASCVKHKM